jgi:hypothetical protein
MTINVVREDEETSEWSTHIRPNMVIEMLSQLPTESSPALGEMTQGARADSLK